MTLRGIYRVHEAPSVEAAWAGVKRMEREDADELRLGELAIERERKFERAERMSGRPG